MMARLGDIALINPRLEKSLDASSPVSFVPMASLSAEEAKVVSTTEKTYAEVAKGYTPFQSGDVLVAKITPCFENGKIAQAHLPHEHGFGSTEFHVIRPRDVSVNARYLHHFLRLERIRIEGERRMTGSGGQRRVPANFLAGLEIRLPSIEEQRRIAAILDQADALRAKRREALAHLDRLAQSVFIEMFGDPVGNPMNWPESQVLGDVAEVVSGITKGRKLPDTGTRSVPYLAVANVQDKALNLAAVKEIEASEDEIRRYTLRKNDLLLTEGGDPDKLGRGTLWNDELPECIHQNHVFRVRLTDDGIHPLFLNWLVGSQRGKKYFLRSAKQTTGIASINMTQLRAFPLFIPQPSLQEQFVNRLQAIESLKAQHRTALADLDALFASLQHRAFRGEL